MDEEERNFCCLSLLLLRVGNPNLQVYFKNKWNSTPGYTPWTDSIHNGTDLVRLRDPDVHKYEVSKRNSGDVTTWDLPLIVRVLLNATPPFVSKASERKALQYLRDTRNDLFHDYPTAKIKTSDFTNKWEKSCNALSMFGGKSRDFKNVKKDMQKPLEELKPFLRRWAEEEKKILDDQQQQTFAKLKQLQDGQIKLHEDHDILKKGQTSLHQSHGRLEEGQATLHQGQGRLEEGQATLHQGQERIEEGQATLHQSQGRLEEGQAALHQGQEKIEQILKERQGGVQQLFISNQAIVKYDFDMQSAISQLCSLQQNTLQQTTCTGSELAKFLKDYYKEGERALILPFPWMEGDRFHIQNLCTSTKITDQDGGNENVPLQDFFSHAQGKKVKRILIQGVPGIGKSTFCKKLAYDWSENKMPNSDSFPELDLVLMINCRDLRTGDLWEAIENQNLPDELRENKADVFRYIRNNQDKILLLVDGYDEIPVCGDDVTMKQSIMELISGKLLPQCRVIVTSRPEKASEIRKHFDKKMEIQGFGSWSDSCTFIKRFFVSSPSMAEDAILSIETITAVRDLMRSPLNAAFLCLVFEERNEDKDVLQSTLDLCSLYDEIVFCVTKRYCTEKQGKVVDDDSLMLHFHDYHVQLGKTAFDLIQSNKSYFGEEQLPKDSKHVLKSLGFLAEQKSLSKIRPKSLYYFTHSSIKEYFAAIYVAETLSKGDIDVLISIMDFQASSSASSVDNSYHVQNVYYSLQRFNLARKSRPISSDCAINLIKNLVSKLPVDVDVVSSEVNFDFIFCFVCELLGSFSGEDEVTHVLRHITLPDVPFVFYAYNAELAIKGLTSLLAHSVDESSKTQVKAFRFEGLQVVSTWLHTMEELSRALGKHIFLETLSLSFFSSFQDMSVFFSHFHSTNLKHLILSFIHQEDASVEDLEFNPLGNILSNFSSLVHLNLRNSAVSEACFYSIAVCPSLKILELFNCSFPEGHLQTLFDVLKSHPSLEELDLSGSMFVDPLMGSYLRNFLLENQRLKSLKLSNCCLDSECINCIFDALTAVNLVTLHLSGNKLDEPLCSYIQKVLTDDETLKDLSLSHCHLNSDCMCFIFNALAENRTLTEIDVSGSTINDWLCPYVKKILIKNQTLNVLKLSHCTIGSEFMALLLNALATNRSSLKEIDLSGIKIAVQQESSSQSLSLHEFLSGSSSSDRAQTSQDFNVFIRDIESIVRGNRHLKVMRLRSCKLCYKSVLTLLGALSENQTLTLIDLTGNEVSDADRQNILCRKMSNPGLSVLI